jgi:AAA+ ATPase superfamily predicted ATPase
MNNVQKKKRDLHKVAMQRTAEYLAIISGRSSLEAKAEIARLILVEVFDYERAIEELEDGKKKPAHLGAG